MDTNTSESNKTDAQPPAFVPVNAAAAAIGIDPRVLIDGIERGHIGIRMWRPSPRGHRLIDRADLQRFLTQRPTTLDPR